MKALMLFGGVLLTLAGCAFQQPPITTNLSETERQEIKSGNLIKLTTIEKNSGNLVLDKVAYPNGIYVCASAWAFPTYHCYPDLGKYIGKYFSDRGIKIVDSPDKADAVVYFNAALWYEGCGPNPNFSFSLQKMLEKNKTILDKVDTHGPGGELLLSAMMVEAMQYSFLSLMGSGGGYWSNRHWMKLTLLKIDKKDITMIPVKDGLRHAVWVKNPGDQQSYEFTGRYIGPAKIEKSSIVIFDESLKTVLGGIIKDDAQKFKMEQQTKIDVNAK